MITSQEHITHAPGETDAWICMCRNTPVADGFFPCDDEGKETEPVTGWKDLYVCAKCGRIIDQKSLEVVGRVSHSQTLA